jgi:hypothetical protein
MGLGRKVKTEHSGAKNGGGFWGRRIVAKLVSRKGRRCQDYKEVQEAENEDSNAAGTNESAGCF